MDEQRHPNWPIIIALVMGIPNWLMLALMVWFRVYPGSSSETDMLRQSGPLMTGWLPVAVVSATSALSAVMLLVVAFRRWKNKKLRAEVKELETAVINLKKERQEAWDQRQEANKAALEANKRANEQKGQKEINEQLYRDEKAKYEKILWVTDIIDKHAEHLNRYVVIDMRSEVRVYLEDSPQGGPRIRCSFKIRNNSIFSEITVHRDKVKGCFSFRGKDLTEKVKLDWHNIGSPMVDKLIHEQDGWIHLEQDLTSAETDRLKNALNSDDAVIGFEEIEIEVSGGARFPDIGKKKLIIPEAFRRILLKECKINGNTDNA
jgi:outer membrane murein-binding lipoprotein Lpp